RAQHHAGAAARRRGRRLRTCRGTAERRFGGSGGRGLGRGGLGRTCSFGRRSVAADAALAALLDHDLLGTAVRETLAHSAGLDTWLEREGLARHTEFLVAGVSRIGHSKVLSSCG